MGRGPRNTRTLAVTVAVCTCSIASVGVAHPFDLFGAGARGAGRAGAMVAGANDHTALYYNPAGMVAGKPALSFGTMLAVDDVNIRLMDRPAGYDLPDLGNGSAAIPSKYRLKTRADTDDIPNTYGLLMGGTTDLGNPDLRLGVSVMLPVTRIARQLSRYPDEREQYFSNRLDFEFLGERSQMPIILAGVAYRFADVLAVGGGFSVLPGADTVASVYLADASKQDEIEITVENDQVGRFAPHLGVLVTPTADLAIGISYRGSNYFRLSLRNDIQIKGFEGDAQAFPTTQDAVVIANYSPDQLTVGVQSKVGAWALSGDLVYMRWSGYLDNQAGTRHGFDDTVSIRAGGEWQLREGRLLRLGVAWEPSPVPDQTGRTNYVDNDRIVMSVGGGHKLDLLGHALEFSWFAQLHGLVTRQTDKKQLMLPPACTVDATDVCDEIPDTTPRADTGQTTAAHAGLQTANPGFPGWQSWGKLLAVGLDLTWRF